jgi:hypothetical protein
MDDLHDLRAAGSGRLLHVDARKRRGVDVYDL